MMIFLKSAMASRLVGVIAGVKQSLLVFGWVTNERKKYFYLVAFSEELDGSAVSALGVRSRKLSNVLNGQS
jgi:hypothetical protein